MMSNDEKKDNDPTMTLCLVMTESITAALHHMRSSSSSSSHSTTPTSSASTATTSTPKSSRASSRSHHRGGRRTDSSSSSNNTITTVPAIPSRVQVTLSQHDSTVRDLYAAAEQALGLTTPPSWSLTDPPKIRAEDALTIPELLLSFGFPPRPLPPSRTTTLIQAGLHHLDKVTVRWEVVAAASSTQTDAPTTTTTESSSSAAAAALSSLPLMPPRKDPPRRPTSQRQAARQASASMAEAIQRQEQVLKEEASKASSKPKDSSRPSRTATSPAKRPRFDQAGQGRRLQDGAPVMPASTGARRSKRPQKNSPDDNDPDGMSGPTAQDSAVDMLLGVVSGGSPAQRLMRQGWRQAVQDAREQNKAVARLAAVTSPTLQFQVVLTSTSTTSTSAAASSLPTSLQVNFDKGVQGRGQYQDVVHHSPWPLLQSVIAAIHPVNSEALRPENLALLSPRVFWSLLYHQREQQLKNGQEIGTASAVQLDVVEALKQAQPDLDWSFLRRRKEQLSEKALENLRQEQEQRAPGDKRTKSWEAAAAAIESVELAMAQIHEMDKSTKRNQMLEAASKRMVWQVVTPNETDLDELRQCILGNEDDSENPSPLGSASHDSARVEKLVESLLRDCNIHNWRELANWEAEDLLPKLKVPDVQLADVEAWIDRAQLESLEEIIVEVCEGDIEGVELIREAARSGTPKDLSFWRGVGEFLREQLLAYQPAPTDGDVASNYTVPNVETLSRWCDRAYQAIQQLEWLECYVTPIAGT